MVNNDLRKQNEDTIDIISPFIPFAADTRIELRLATKDPQGNETDGINYIHTDSAGWSTGWNVQYDSTGGKSSWPTDKYLNIWVVEMFSNITGGGKGSLPDTIFLERQGIIITNNMIGSIGTGLDKRIFTHETGHFFNLLHLWGKLGIPGDSTNCNKDDEVSDTPNCFGSSYYYGSPSGLWAESCGSIDNTQNYMDYSPSNIVCMFTIGQAERMHEALNSNIAGRNNLHDYDNLVLTGVIDNSNINESKSLQSVSFYPNPINDFLNIRSTSILIKKIECFDSIGRKVISLSFNNLNSVKINFDYLEKGTYIIKINNWYSHKFIKR